MNIEEVYRVRAERLAARPSADAGRATFAALVFGLGTERYAIDLPALAEVFPFRGCTEVLGAPPALLGVINVRGEIRPVADLKRILELPDVEGPAGYVVMLRRAGGLIGMRVDTVDGVQHLDQKAMTPGSGFIKAVTAETVIVIDTAAVLDALFRRT